MTIAPPLTEAAFMAQVTDLAELRGWEWFHVRAGRTLDSWRTPGSGTMARGWPDLVLAKPPRLLFIELKRDNGRLTEHQARVLDVLGAFMVEAPEVPDGFPTPEVRSYLHGVIAGLEKGLHDAPDIEVAVWRPKDWPLIEATLR